MAVADEIRQSLARLGVDVPKEPERPPMDVAEIQVRLMAQRLSALAVELGVEFDFQLYPGSLVNGARSISRIDQAIAGCAIAIESTAVVCGLDLPHSLSKLPRAFYDANARQQIPNATV